MFQKKTLLLLFAVTLAPAFAGLTHAATVSFFSAGELKFVDAPELTTSDKQVNALYRRALETVEMNVVKSKRGIMEEPDFLLNAGKNYDRPWTRDTSYNTMFAAGLVAPRVARNTLLSVLIHDKEHGTRIGGQYWDAIAWVTGAWAYYGYTGDEEFLKRAYDASKNSIRYFEDREYDAETGLFDGPGWSDGVAGYPMPYADANGSSFILNTKAKVGRKLVMKALSTNCLYANAYAVLAAMAEYFGDDPGRYSKKAKALRKAINDKLWMEEKGRYAYFLDVNGKKEESMEGLGHAFAVLFDIAPRDRAVRVLQHQHVTAHGIPCVWPVYPRFGNDFGRHDGTVWPQIQGFWARACAKAEDEKRFCREFAHLTRLVAGSGGNFREIYHPLTGKPYGGIQCGRLWKSTHHQTWCATAYLSMVYHGVFGMRFSPDGVTFEPIVPQGMQQATLTGLRLKSMTFDVHLRGSGQDISSFKLDGKECDPSIPGSLRGRHVVEIELK